MQYETLLIQRDGPVMTVRLNRPEKLNGINRQMHADLQALCAALRSDFETRVVIITGEGRAFSAGADLKEPPPAEGPVNDLERRHRMGLGGRTCDALEALDQITITAHHGATVGGAVVIAASCDIRVAAESAWFSVPEVELGMPLSWNALPRLAREMGPSRALELTVTCDRIDARQALAYNLVGHVVPDGELMDFTRALAGRIAAKPEVPVALTKAHIRAIRRGYAMGEVSYSDPDLHLYTRVLEQRRRHMQ